MQENIRIFVGREIAVRYGNWECVILPERVGCIFFPGPVDKGLTGFDSRQSREVSMPSIVRMARKYQRSTFINGNNSYALAA